MAQNKRSKSSKQKKASKYDGIAGMFLMACAILVTICGVMCFLADQVAMCVICVVLAVVFVGVSQIFNGNYSKRR